MLSFLCFLYSVLPLGPFKFPMSLPVSSILYVLKDNSSYSHTSAICTLCCSNTPVLPFQIQCWPEAQITQSWCLPLSVCSAPVNRPRHLPWLLCETGSRPRTTFVFWPLMAGFVWCSCLCLIQLQNFFKYHLCYNRFFSPWWKHYIKVTNWNVYYDEPRMCRLDRTT